MRLIIGLGNPGRRYADTRHNVGYQVLERLSTAHHIPLKEKTTRSRIGRGKIEGRDVILALPETYMNRSGEAVEVLRREARVSPEEVLVILDDMDLEPGVLRIRQQGSSGGHRGVASIVQAIGSQSFPRIRIGIGRPPQKDQVTDYVLSPFMPEELPKLEEAMTRAVDAVISIVRGEILAAMNRYNQ